MAWSLIGFAAYYFQRTIRTKTANYLTIQHDIVWNNYELLKEINKKLLLGVLISGAVFFRCCCGFYTPMNNSFINSQPHTPLSIESENSAFSGLWLLKTQFQIEGGGLVQVVTKQLWWGVVVYLFISLTQRISITSTTAYTRFECVNVIVLLASLI